LALVGFQLSIYGKFPNWLFCTKAYCERGAVSFSGRSKGLFGLHRWFFGKQALFGDESLQRGQAQIQPAFFPARQELVIAVLARSIRNRNLANVIIRLGNFYYIRKLWVCNESCSPAILLLRL
jgi:hypothetical protein